MMRARVGICPGAQKLWGDGDDEERTPDVDCNPDSYDLGGRKYIIDIMDVRLVSLSFSFIACSV